MKPAGEQGSASSGHEDVSTAEGRYRKVGGKLPIKLAHKQLTIEMDGAKITLSREASTIHSLTPSSLMECVSKLLAQLPARRKRKLQERFQTEKQAEAQRQSREKVQRLFKDARTKKELKAEIATLKEQIRTEKVKGFKQCLNIFQRIMETLSIDCVKKIVDKLTALGGMPQETKKKMIVSKGHFGETVSKWIFTNRRLVWRTMFDEEWSDFEERSDDDDAGQI